ncbi:MAG: pyridoxamine 5'-phosphate oxidase family protein [Pseudomonadota bacterium]
MQPLKQTPRNTVRRVADRGSFDRQLAYDILDEALICHVAFVADDQPMAIPTAFARDGDELIVHGSVASRMLKTLATEMPVCITVTLLDGIVLARSVFESSMNYRSVVAMGNAKLVTEPAAKLAALHRLTEHLAPRRWEDARQPSEKELNATSVLTLALDEATVKVRKGPPKDLEKDLERPIWAGVIPLALTADEPITDLSGAAVEAVPDYVAGYQRKTARDAGCS